jgi:hypothetical protein
MSRATAVPTQVLITLNNIVWMNFARGIMQNPRIEIIATRYPRVV